MTRTKKIWLTVICVPVLILVCGVTAAKFYFSGERLKALVVPRLEQATHRSVQLKSISLTIFPSFGVEIDSLAIANARGRGFSASPCIALDKLLLKVRLFSLLSGKLEATTLILDQPRILIERNEWGDANYADFIARLDTAGSPPAPAGQHQGESKEPASGLSLLFTNIQIRNGSLDYVDHKDNTAARIRGLNHTMQLDINNGARIVRMDAQTSTDQFTYGTIQSAFLPELHFTLDEQILYNQDEDRLTIQKGIVTVQDIVLLATGSVSAVSKHPVLALSVEADRLNIADLLSLVPAAYMKKAEGLKGTGTARVRVSITGTVSDTSKPEFRGTISAADASLQYAALPQPITNVSVVASFERSAAKQELTVERLSAKLGNNPFSISLKVVNFDDPWITMTVAASMNLAEIKDYYPLEPGTDLQGALSANMSIAGNISKPGAMTGSGTLDFRNVTIKTPHSSKPLQNLEGSITVTNNTVESKKISMVLGHSDLTLAFSLKNYLSLTSGDPKAPRSTATLSLASNSLSTADLMADTSAPKPPRKDGPAAPGGPKRDNALALPDADLDVTATVGTLVMEKFSLKNVKALVSISHGVFTLRSCTMNAFDGSVSTTGTLNLKNLREPEFNMTLNATNVDAHAMLSKFTTFGERMFGRLGLSTDLKGTLDDTLGLVAQSLNGKGNVQAHDGSLTGMKVNKEIASALKLPDLETIHYKDWSNEFTVAAGRMVVKDLKINALDADYLVNGSQGLDGSMDYTMAVLLADKTSSRISVPGFAGQAIDLFRDNTGRVRLDFNVTGTMNDPHVVLNTEAAKKKAEDLVKQKASAEGKKLQDQLKTKATDVLKGLFKKKP